MYCNYTNALHLNISTGSRVGGSLQLQPPRAIVRYVKIKTKQFRFILTTNAMQLQSVPTDTADR